MCGCSRLAASFKLRLPQEALAEALVACQFGREHLQGDAPVEREVVRRIHGAIEP